MSDPRMPATRQEVVNVEENLKIMLNSQINSLRSELHHERTNQRSANEFMFRKFQEHQSLIILKEAQAL